jgi:hypothetical protein
MLEICMSGSMRESGSLPLSTRLLKLFLRFSVFAVKTLGPYSTRF